MISLKCIPVALFSLLITFFANTAFAADYKLEIAMRPVTVSGEPLERITVNGSIPGPALHFTEGEEVHIAVTNKLDVPTSIHWHGLLLPGEMDGVPGMNGFPGIAPGQTFNYHFRIRQSGTYWYHAHSVGQEQDGLYGSLVITPKAPEKVVGDRDYVVLFSDFSEELSGTILQNLKLRSDYYNYSQQTLLSFIDSIRSEGFSKTWRETTEWGQMRMSRSDLSDVSGYHFLVNGMTAEQNWTGLFSAGESVRLRFINASAMSIYDVRIPGLRMELVAADGQEIEPVSIDEFRMGVAETYDVIVRPEADKAYTIVAEPIDRTGFALGTIAPRAGMRGE